MYGDLIVDKGKLKKVAKEEVCPICGSTEIEDSYGVFISKTRYMQTMVCMACSAQWNVIYDSDLNVVDVNTGG